MISPQTSYLALWGQFWVAGPERLVEIEGTQIGERIIFQKDTDPDIQQKLRRYNNVNVLKWKTIKYGVDQWVGCNCVLEQYTKPKIVFLKLFLWMKIKGYWQFFHVYKLKVILLSLYECECERVKTAKSFQWLKITRKVCTASKLLLTLWLSISYTAGGFGFFLLYVLQKNNNLSNMIIKYIHIS